MSTVLLDESQGGRQYWQSMHATRISVVFVATMAMAILFPQLGHAGRAGGKAAAKAPVRGQSIKKAKSSGARRSKRKTESATLRQGLPKKLGEGTFSKVFLSRDGKWVIKAVKPMVRVRMSVTPAERTKLATVTVNASELMRGAGFPVPRSFVPKDRVGMIVQRYQKGISVREMSPEQFAKAEPKIDAMLKSAKKFAKKNSNGNWLIDSSLDNFLFHKNGSIKAWIDPVIPKTPNRPTVW